jgi:hypothetical protein
LGVIVLIPSIELQRAVQITLNAGIYPVHDQFQQDEPMPFITIGEETLLDISTKIEDITSHLITVHTWSDSISSKEVKEMNYFIKNALLDSPFNVDGFVVLFSALDFNQTFKEQDGTSIKYHGVTQIEFRLQEV